MTCYSARRNHRLHKNHTLTLVPPSSTYNVVRSNLIFGIKYKSDGSVLKHKVRLVAKVFHLYAGIDYDETFSLIDKSSTIRIILTLVVQFD